MTRKQVLEVISGKEVDVSTLDKNSSYIFTIELGDMSKAQVLELCHRFSEMMHNAQIEHFVIVPTRNGVPDIKIYEFKDNAMSEVK